MPAAARGLLAAAIMAACARPAPPTQAARPEVEDMLQRLELARVPSGQIRSLLASSESPVRARAAIAAGRVSDPEAVPRLTALLEDRDAAEPAAWALGRIPGGAESLARCLQSGCPAATHAARALSGPEAFKQPAVDVLVLALSGPAAREAASRWASWRETRTRSFRRRRMRTSLPL
jgi:hypothetical protein